MTTSSDEDGTVLRECVITVLRAHGVSVTHKANGTFVIAKDARVEQQEFPERLARNMIHRLSRLYGIETHKFYQEQN